MPRLNTVLRHLEAAPEPLFGRAERADDARVADWWADARGEDASRAQAAREQLITHFAPLVGDVAGRMIGRLPDTVELGDLASYGMFGLIDAVEKFEPERGFKFETYAATRVRGAIIDELRAADWVPRSVRAKARQVEKATRELEQQLQRTVSDEDVAALLDWDCADVRAVRAQVALSHIAALEGLGDEDADDGAGTRAAEALRAPAPGAGIEDREARALLGEAMGTMREREQEVLRLYYFEDLTLAQIGQILGVTESRVSQIHSAAVKRLRVVLEKTGAFA